MFLLTTISNGSIIKQLNRELSFKNVNNQIYLGSAVIIGNGSSSILEATAENDLLIRIDSESDIIDFYIDYNMICSGTTDEGIITLTIFIDDSNMSFNVIQTPFNKSGNLIVENIEVNRGEKLTFLINVIYGSIIPPYTNSTSATGIGVINKSTDHDNKFSNYILTKNFEKRYYIFPLLKQIFKINNKYNKIL